MKRLRSLFVAMIAALFLFGSAACVTNPKLEPVAVEGLWVHDGAVHVVCTGFFDDALGFKLEQLLTQAMDSGINRLVIHLDNGGGSAIVMFDVINTLERFQARGLHITTVARGIVASAAIPLFLVGDERISYADTMFMVHPIGGWNNPMVQECDMVVVRELSERYTRYLIKKTSWPPEFCRYRMMPENPNFNRDTFCLWFDAEAALSWGFATKIEK